MKSKKPMPLKLVESVMVKNTSSSKTHYKKLMSKKLNESIHRHKKYAVAPMFLSEHWQEPVQALAMEDELFALAKTKYSKELKEGKLKTVLTKLKEEHQKSFVQAIEKRLDRSTPKLREMLSGGRK